MMDQQDNTINIIQSYNDYKLNCILQKFKGQRKSFLDLIHTVIFIHDFYALCDRDDFWKIE